jgi:UPF0755 protein
MRRVLLFIFLIVFLGAVAAAWILFGSGTGFDSNRSFLYISSKAATREAVLDSLSKNKLIKNTTAFDMLADKWGYWKSIKPGKYEIKKGAGIFSVVRMLRNGRQSEVKLTIKHIRTKEDLARMTGNLFEFDSLNMMNFLNSDDSLKKYNVPAEQSMSMVLPDTYSFYWNTTPSRVFKKLADVSDAFWTKERKAKAKNLNLSKAEVYTLASIVEEETNDHDEMDTIASVYLNRLAKGIKLQADPTVKFALRDFTIKRVYASHTQFPSPYNTYYTKGLPPGPICTPSRKTIDAVLDAAKTDYVYFVASPAFDGTHDFSVTYEEHQVKAKAYQEELDRRQIGKPDSLQQKP